MVHESAKQRVLYFCSRLPSNIQGGLDLRVQSQISALLGFAEVYVFGLNGKGAPFHPQISSWRASKNEGVSRQLDALQGMSALLSGRSPFESRFSEETADELRSEIRLHEPDVIVISRIDLTVYLEVVQEEFSGKLILDLDETVGSTGPSILKIMQHPGQALVFKTFNERVSRLEQNVLGVVDQIWVCSAVERKRLLDSDFRDIDPTSKIVVVPNSVSVGDYTTMQKGERLENTLIYPASFAYEPSLDAAKFLIYELMPLLPNFRLRFVGSHIPSWMRNLQLDNVTSEGPVPSIIPYLKSSTALVVPLRAGGGTRLKVIEALAAGLPVVSTEFGVEGLNLEAGLDYLRAESAEDFAEQCRKLLRNQDMRNALASKGIKTATRSFSTISLKELLMKTLSG